MILKINFENPQERLYFENKAKKLNSRKDELLEIHGELCAMITVSD